MANEAITPVSPIVSSTARSVARIVSGVIRSSVIPVKFALNTLESFAIISWPTLTGRWTSLFLTVSLLIMATLMNVFASMYMRSKRFIVAGGGAAMAIAG